MTTPRVIPIHSFKHGSLLFRGGAYYRLPKELADELVAEGLAYFEGDEPSKKQDRLSPEAKAKALERRAKYFEVLAEQQAKQDIYVDEKRLSRATTAAK